MANYASEISATPPAIEEAVIASRREGRREFLRFLSRSTRTIDEAEEILQDFYLKTIRSARTIKEPDALKGWWPRYSAGLWPTITVAPV